MLKIKKNIYYPGFQSYLRHDVYMEHEKPGYLYPCEHDSNSIQVSDGEGLF